jgi:sulfite oxidase
VSLHSPPESCQRLVFDSEGLNTAVWPRADHVVTPAELFFTRSHAPIPEIDPREWRLEVGGLVQHPKSFSLEELTGAFAQRQVTATLVCAGLRRREFLSLGPLPGEIPWGPEPASTGAWTGFALRDLLRAVGVTGTARHVEFTGLDEVERLDRRFPFGSSIDLDKALSGEVILATHLNDRPLPPAHGFPLRAVVPGWIGARSVKWLGRITLLEEPSPNYFQSKAYRLQRVSNPLHPRDVSAGVALTEVPVNAVILEPSPDQQVAAGRVRVRGWAIGTGGRSLARVMVSPDGGRRWIGARISLGGEPWTWSLWEAALDLDPGQHTLLVRALDSSGATQPETVGATWNVKGYNNNAWHRTTIHVV